MCLQKNYIKNFKTELSLKRRILQLGNKPTEQQIVALYLRSLGAEVSFPFSPSQPCIFSDQSRCKDPQSAKKIHILILKIVDCSNPEHLFGLTTTFIDSESVFTLPLLLGTFKQAAASSARTAQNHIL